VDERREQGEEAATRRSSSGQEEGASEPSVAVAAEEVGRLFRQSVVTHTGAIQWQQGELLGEGAYGKVFAGLNQQTGELMAVKQHKLPAPELMGDNTHLAR
jgi:serine/threonine protein kinase